MAPEDAHDGFHMLHLNDCYIEDEDFDEFQDDQKDDPYELKGNAYDPGDEIASQSLGHIVCDNPDPSLRKLWLSAPNMRLWKCTCVGSNYGKTIGTARSLLNLWKEPVLKVPFHLDDLQAIVAAPPELCPHLKMLKLEMSQDSYDEFLDPEWAENFSNWVQESSKL
ncbi:hypothetical protein B0H10DRAFT_1938794 [Mycena sp. CBHHK59/15]|nr:hypothetical protein B0H10DRAFT_1938794 [Mycena sp. CBHHK59/15]